MTTCSSDIESARQTCARSVPPVRASCAPSHAWSRSRGTIVTSSAAPRAIRINRSEQPARNASRSPRAKCSKSSPNGMGVVDCIGTRGLLVVVRTWRTGRLHMTNPMEIVKYCPSGCAAGGGADVVTARTRGRRCRRGGPRWSGEVVDEDRSGQHADRAVGAQPPVPPGSWRWRRARRGVVHALAAWCLVGVAVISTLALVIVIVFGLAAGGEKAGGLQMTIAAACLVPVSCCVLVVLARPVPVGRRLRRTVGRLRPGRGSGGGRPVPNVLVGLVETLSRVEVGLGVWSGALGLALLNWVADALVLGLAVHVLVPTVGWASVVVAYAVGQFASQIPLTPGG